MELEVDKKIKGAEIIDGKYIAQRIQDSVRAEVAQLDPKPGLAALLIGDDPASTQYIGLKSNACEYVDIDFNFYEFNELSTEEEIIEAIEFLNVDPQVNGILVQLPLPEKYNTQRIIEAITPTKDVDGFHPANINKIQKKDPFILSPLALGIDAMIKETKVELKGLNVTVLCNHDVFAEPFKYLYGKDNEVVVLNPDDKELKEKTRSADILIVAIGKAKEITNEFIKSDVIVIDVGINKLGDQTVGDVDFENVMLKASFITPVPGGVGPMTVAVLLENVVKLYKIQHKIK